VTIRVDSMWLYQIIISYHIGVQYNLNASITNDVSVSIFNIIRDVSSSIMLIRSEPQG